MDTGIKQIVKLKILLKSNLSHVKFEEVGNKEGRREGWVLLLLHC